MRHCAKAKQVIIILRDAQLLDGRDQAPNLVPDLRVYLHVNPGRGANVALRREASCPWYIVEAGKIRPGSLQRRHLCLASRRFPGVEL